MDDSGDARADLHAHTIASDGTFTPEELAEEAQWKGLSAVAITDHDAVDGVAACVRRGGELGVEIVPGVELSSHEGNGDIHIVGLFIDPTHGLLMECLAELRQEREERVSRIVTKLNGLGVALDERDVYEVAGSAPPGRVHVAEALRRRGAVQSLNAAFDRYISDDGPAYVARKLLSPERAIDVVHAAGGVAVFAHPGLTQKDHRIPDLAAHGLDGLEVRCLHHRPSVEARYQAMARRLGLLPSGGSDFHGDRNASVSLGAAMTPMSYVDDLRAAARRVRASATTASNARDRTHALPKGAATVAWFGLDKLKAGLQKTRDKIGRGIKAVFTLGRAIDDDFLEEVEEALLAADLGPKAALEIINDLQDAYKQRKATTADELYNYLKGDLKARLSEWDTEVKLAAKPPTVIMVAGVNGVGKTTSIAKLAKMYIDDGKKVLVAAADTFRAAAVEQLEIWSRRVGADIVKHQMGADPGAVTYDAIDAAKARGIDVVIVDTAGRLHTRGNLMQELGKIRRVIEKNTPDGPHEVLLVLDATTGQNAVSQVREFRAVIDVTGLFLAKLDGTAKGGIVLGMKSEFDVPVKFVGLGEKADDIAAFDPDSFVDAIFED